MRRHGVHIWEGRPGFLTLAHADGDLDRVAEAFSRSIEEMQRAGSLLLQIARQCAVPAGHALAVDRVTFAEKVTQAISQEPRITVRREEVISIEESGQQITVIATGPLTSEALAAEIARLSNAGHDAAPQNPHQDPHLYF